MLTDTHCHLDLEHFDMDRDEVIERARLAGLVRLLIPAVDLDGAQKAIESYASIPEIHFAVGLHPTEGATWEPGSPARIRTLAVQPKVVAIGEIGLDYYWDKTPKDLQREIFSKQLELAAELELPVVVHNREATADVLEMLLGWQHALAAAGSPLAACPGVLHSFSGNKSEAAQALAANFMIGVTGPVTFKNALDLQDLVTGLPLDRLLIETDSPYLTPHPLRGKRNEPGHVRLVAEKIAELKGVDLEEVLDVTYRNSERIFGW